MLMSTPYDIDLSTLSYDISLTSLFLIERSIGLVSFKRFSAVSPADSGAGVETLVPIGWQATKNKTIAKSLSLEFSRNKQAWNPSLDRGS